MKISAQQRTETEQRIRDAIELLVSPHRPGHLRCDVSTLAAQAGISRNTLYSIYTDLRREFEQRRTAQHTQPQAHHDIEQRAHVLSETVIRLKALLADRDRTIADLIAFRQLAISRLAAQHEEIIRLRISPSAGGPGGAHFLRRIDSPR